VDIWRLSGSGPDIDYPDPARCFFTIEPDTDNL